jgi:signal transduction histidine kinase
MSRFRPPMLAVAIVLLGLFGLLASLQYRWLGQISQAERERIRSTLDTGATEFAQDFDRELTRAYLLFQMEPAADDEMAARVAGRYDQWQATARFPRILKDYYVFVHGPGGTPQLQRFDPGSRRLEPVAWPESMADWRAQLMEREVAGDPSGRTVFISRVIQPIWEKASAIVAPMPMPLGLFADQRSEPSLGPPGVNFSYAIVTLDLEYVRSELLPSLAERHFSRGAEALGFQVAVVRTGDAGELVYTSTPSFRPAVDSRADATADLFQVRTQDFASIAADVRRFTAFAATVHKVIKPGDRGASTSPPNPSDVVAWREGRPLSIYVQAGGPHPGGIQANSTRETRIAAVNAPRWKLMLQHPSGSLEAAVDSVRRRNLVVSSSVLGVLGASMGLLVLSTRRAQRLARQQMEFVAAVSHELRTPLAVIRSAADNLADGVVLEDEQIRKYGELMRGEGRRLTEMVEQILELSGIQSGQRGFALSAVAIEPLLDDILASSASLIEGAGLHVEVAIPPDLPPVLGDGPALRRVFQNLVGNAIKYGTAGGWIGLSAARSGSTVRITVADRGMGIPAAEQSRIFEPFYRASDAIAAQIQGAGLGLSLVQRIVEAHGGRVFVKSAPREGSEFTVQLPAAGGAAEALGSDRGQTGVSPSSDPQPLADAPRYS